MKMEQEEIWCCSGTHCVREVPGSEHSLRTDLRYIPPDGSAGGGWGWAKTWWVLVQGQLEELWWKFRMRVA